MPSTIFLKEIPPTWAFATFKHMMSGITTSKAVFGPGVLVIHVCWVAQNTALNTYSG